MLARTLAYLGWVRAFLVRQGYETYDISSEYASVHSPFKTGRNEVVQSHYDFSYIKDTYPAPNLITNVEKISPREDLEDCLLKQTSNSVPGLVALSILDLHCF
jgi:hypothetical protein